MKIKTGTDIIEIKRIARSIERHGNNFIDTIFTEAEKELCEKYKVMKYQHYAVRFAAKEAIFKALSFHYTECKWKDYEILNSEDGKPFVKLNEQIPEIEDIDISLSHCREYAVANVVVLLK